MPSHYLKEIEHFFQVYKDLEGAPTETRGFEGAAAARGAMVRAMELYESKFTETASCRPAQLVLTLRSDTGGPRISRQTIASRSCSGV